MKRSDNPPVKILDRLDLVLYAALMPHFVGRFDMDIGKVIAVLEERF